MSATPAPASAGALQGNTPAGAPPAAAGNHASGSLYVGDLQSDVTEALLFEVFNPVGPVSSIRVCRDASSRMSLGYAYVNFHSVVDAERALDTLNFSPIKGRPCRIMWSHRDPSARKNATSNIFIKNLDKSVDNKTLYDTFSRFGSILSCKVATDPSLQSRGFAFVHYEKEEDAQKAIDEVNGMMIAGKKVFVGKFERRANRSGGSESKFTNVYVKNIPNEWDEAKFREEFGKFGTITSLVLQTDAEGKHKGFGFVNYDSHDEAVSAKEEGGKIPTGNDKPLFVDRFQKKAERSAILQRRYEDQQREKSERYKNLNLYVKNFEDDMTDEKLRELFEQHGEVSSAVVMKDDRENSRGFGFVCFSNPDDASKALAALNGKMIGTKPLYVNRAQRKDERRAHLEGQFQANFAGQRIAPLAPVFFNPAGMMGPMAMYNQFGGVRGGGSRFPQHSGMRYPGAGYPGSQMKRGGRAPQQGRQGVPGGPGRSANPQKFRQAGPGGPRGYRDSSVPTMPMPAVPSPMAAQPAPAADLMKILAHSDAETQKQVLGEKLFPLVQQEKPDLAGKITGMLLEMDTSDILGLIESQSELRSKIDEAMNVLQSHTTAEGSA